MLNLLDWDEIFDFMVFVWGWGVLGGLLFRCLLEGVWVGGVFFVIFKFGV